MNCSPAAVTIAYRVEEKNIARMSEVTFGRISNKTILQRRSPPRHAATRKSRLRIPRACACSCRAP
jgi:hypothetical protein